MKKVAFYTLGCKLNFSETSTLSRMVESIGHTKVEFHESPDVFIINTCSVTDNADKKCRKIVRDAKRINPNAYIALVGCYAQLKPEEIAQIPGVDAVLGASEKFQLPELLNEFVKKQEPVIMASPIDEVNDFHFSFSINDRTRTFLKVQDGCNYNCSFCTIPLARGKSRSDSIEGVVAIAEQIARNDVKEIVLTGVNTGDFGIQKGKRKERFFDLINELDNVEGIERFRISSIEPNLLSEEIIHFVSQSKKFVPHFHIPLQSGSDYLLKRMRRRYKSKLYRERIDLIRKLMPNACIGVDVIVGFPGETDERFMETLDFLKGLDISYLHVFTYSERPNTPAAEMDNPVPLKLREERSKILRNLSKKLKRRFYLSNRNRECTVLFEHDITNERIRGFTENYIRVSANARDLKPNMLVTGSLADMQADGTMDFTIGGNPSYSNRKDSMGSILEALKAG